VILTRRCAGPQCYRYAFLISAVLCAVACVVLEVLRRRVADRARSAHRALTEEVESLAVFDPLSAEEDAAAANASVETREAGARPE
jgi:hypothetical protein